MYKFKKIMVLLSFCLIACRLAVPVSELPVHAAEVSAPIRIACVGDSITYGYTSSNPSFHSYPSQLKNLLGEGYEVGNFGVSGYTLMKSGDRPYWSAPQYAQSRQFEPDIVLLMLGTNDSKETNWVHKDEFLADLKELIEIYKQLPGEPEVYVCTSLRLPVEYEHEDTKSGLNRAVIEEEIVPFQEQAADETGCPLIDTHGFSEREMADEDFKDYAHPTDIGYQKLANYIFGSLTGKEISMEIIDDTEFTFEGSEWKESISSGSINGENGTEHYAQVTESNASSHTYEVSFVGTRIQIYGELSPNHGIVSYSVDGGEEMEVDSYAPSRSVHTILYQASGLEDGVHTLKATATAKKSAPASNSCIQVDYAKVFTEYTCTCAIDSLRFYAPSVTIPWDAPSADVALNASGSLAQCRMSGHQERTLNITYALQEDAKGAFIDGDRLIVSEPGTIAVTAKAEISGTELKKEKTAYFTVMKAEKPKQTVPDPPVTQKPDPAPDQTVKPAKPLKLARPVLKAKKSGSKVKLTWKRNPKADGYTIQMKTGKGNYKKIAAKKSSVVSYTKKKLKKGKTYSFRIQSYKKQASSTVCSKWSKAVKVKL